MGTAAQGLEHTPGIGSVSWFAKDLVAHNHHCISRDDQFILPHHLPIGVSLLAGDIEGDLAHRGICRIRLIDILQHPHLERHSQSRKQFLPSWRITGQYDAITLHSQLSHHHPKALAFITHLPWARSTCSMTSRPQP